MSAERINVTFGDSAKQFVARMQATKAALRYDIGTKLGNELRLRASNFVTGTFYADCVLAFAQKKLPVTFDLLSGIRMIPPPVEACGDNWGKVRFTM